MSACPRCGGVVAGPDQFCRSCGASVATMRDRAAAIPYRLILTIIGLLYGVTALVILLVAVRKIVFYLVIAMFLALVINPAAERLTRWRLSRGASIAVVVVTAFIAIAGIGTLMAAPLATQGARFAQEAPTYLQQAERDHTGPIYDAARRLGLEDQIAKIRPGLTSTLSNLSNKVLELGQRIAAAVFTAAIIVILAIFMLAEGPKLVDSSINMIPRKHRAAARRVGRTTSRVVSGYTSGVLLMALLNGTVAGLAMWATGTPFLLPLAVWATVVDILPIVGGLFAVVPAALFAFTHSIPAGIIVTASILIYQQIKNHVLYPVLIGRAVSMSSLLVLVAVLVGTELGHIGGAILAIPIAGVIQAVLQEIGRHRREHRALMAAEDVVTGPDLSGPDDEASAPRETFRKAAARLRRRPR